jgi:hypothetical protein
MADELSSRAQGIGDEFNAFGKAEWVGQRMGEDPSGNPNRGLIGNPLPTCFVAHGQDVTSRDDFKKGVRAGMSSTRNDSLAKRGEAGRK